MSYLVEIKSQSPSCRKKRLAGVKYFEVSATTGNNIELSFGAVLSLVLETVIRDEDGPRLPETHKLRHG